MAGPDRRPELRHVAEWLLARLAMAIAGALPPTVASALFGGLARWLIAPLPISRRADDNLRLAMPELDAGQRRAVITAMWRHLGRMIGELPHLRGFELGPGGGPNSVEIVGAEILERLGGEGRPMLFFSGHVGNWEIVPQCMARRGYKPHLVYRAANNPLVDRMIEDLRGDACASTIPKGPAGARAIVAALRRGESVAMLVDQKMNDGIVVPFFGHPAMTAPALAELARRYELPMVPTRCERLDRTRFRVTIQEPLYVARDGEREADVSAAMARVNAVLEDWIRQRPEQWLWLHRRWPKDAYGG